MNRIGLALHCYHQVGLNGVTCLLKGVGFTLNRWHYSMQAFKLVLDSEKDTDKVGSKNELSGDSNLRVKSPVEMGVQETRVSLSEDDRLSPQTPIDVTEDSDDELMTMRMKRQRSEEYDKAPSSPLSDYSQSSQSKKGERNSMKTAWNKLKQSLTPSWKAMKAIGLHKW